MAIKEAALFGLISGIFSAIRLLVSPEKVSATQYIISALISIPVGVIAGFVCIDYNIPMGLSFAVVAGTALVAENIIKVVMLWGTRFQENPKKALKELWSQKDVSRRD